jgi:hypothetical protein
MANGPYQNGIMNFALGNVVWKAAGGSNIRTALVDTADYAVDLATHNFMDDVAAASREETSGNMTLVDAAVDGVVDASDVAFVGTAGDQCEGIIVYRFVTVDGDSLPLFWWDSVAGMPVTLGGDVTVSWDNGANKIAKI